MHACAPCAPFMKASRAPFWSANNRLHLVFRAVRGELWQGRNLDGGSNARWCRTGRLSTAAMPAEPEMSPRGSRKRVSRIERKAMVESFVNKYRAQHGGQFPNTSVAQKEVGGSYYVILNIMQELKHACKHGHEVVTCKNNSTRDTISNSEIKTPPIVKFQADGIEAVELSTSCNKIEVSHQETVEVKDVLIVGVTPEIMVEKSVDGEPERLSALDQDKSSLPSSQDLMNLHPRDGSALQEVVVVESASGSHDHARPSEDISESIRKEYNDKLKPTSSHLYKDDCGISHRQEGVPDGTSDESVEYTLKPSVSSSKPIDERDSSDLNRAQRDLSSNTMDEVSTEKKSSSLWSNLKYFAGSLISFWNK